MKTENRTIPRAARSLPREGERMEPGGDLAQLFRPTGAIALLKWRIRERVLLLFRKPAKPGMEDAKNGTRS